MEPKGSFDWNKALLALEAVWKIFFPTVPIPPPPVMMMVKAGREDHHSHMLEAACLSLQAAKLDLECAADCCEG